MRVVSVGPTVEALLASASAAEPASAAPLSSIELCGGTHISNTAEAREFVLAEETAVAKGIRRVVGLTSEPALAAREAGAQLAAECDRIDASSTAIKAAAPVELDSYRTDLAELRTRIDAATASAPLKARLRDEVASKDKAMTKQIKALLAREVDLAAGEAIETATAADAAGEPYVVIQLGAGLEKAATPLVQKVQKAVPNVALMVFAPGAEKVQVVSAVPKAVDALKANEWLKAALEPVGGRGGGKAASAQGSGPGVDRLDDAVAAARDFAAAALA